MFLLTAVPATAIAQLAGVSEVRISSPQHAGSDVDPQSLVYSPDGDWVCFVGDTETEGAGELWCADTGAGAPAVRVSGLMPSGSAVDQPGFNGEGSRVFFIAPGADTQKEELFMVPPDGSQAPVRLSAPLAPAGADVTSYRYVPETDQVVYIAPSQVASEVQLHVVSVGSPEVVTVLNGPLVSGGDVIDYEVVPAAGRVVYLADQQVDEVRELYSVQLDGAGAVKLNGPPVAGGDVLRFEVSPDGARVAYRADEDTNEVEEIYLALTDGGGSTKVSGPVVADGDAAYFQFSLDSQWLLFHGDLAINGWRHLYSTPADGSQAVPNLVATQIDEVPPGPGFEAPPRWWVTDDGTQVLFLSEQGDSSSVRALRAPIDGSSSAVVLTGGLNDVRSLSYAPDSERIIVRNGTAPGNLFSIAVDASSFLPLTNFVAPTVDVSGIPVPGGVLYTADPDVDERYSVFFVDDFGLQTRELSSTSEFFRGLASPPSPTLPEDRSALYFVERHGSAIAVLYSFRLKRVDLVDFRAVELARIGNSVFVTGENSFEWFLSNPTNPNQVAYVADKPTDEQSDAYLATFADALFADRFEDD
jgi:Tol biopolymer transport system component